MATKLRFNPFIGNLDYTEDQTFLSNSGSLVFTTNCDVSVDVEDVVIMNSGIAVQAIASSISTGRAIGLCERKLSPTSCIVIVSGISEIGFTGLSENRDYFLSDSTPGQLIITPPSASGSVVMKLGTALTDSSFVVNRELKVIRS